MANFTGIKKLFGVSKQSNFCHKQRNSATNISDSKIIIGLKYLKYLFIFFSLFYKEMYIFCQSFVDTKLLCIVSYYFLICMLEVKIPHSIILNEFVLFLRDFKTTVSHIVKVTQINYVSRNQLHFTESFLSTFELEWQNIAGRRKENFLFSVQF